MAVCCFGLLGVYRVFQEMPAFRISARKKETAGKAGVIGLLAAQFILSVPNVIYYLENTEFDPSWRYFLNIANVEGLKFGRDIYFTYGPLGYLCLLMKLPENAIYYWTGIAIWGICLCHAYLAAFTVCIGHMRIKRQAGGDSAVSSLYIWRATALRQAIIICCIWWCCPRCCGLRVRDMWRRYRIFCLY